MGEISNSKFVCIPFFFFFRSRDCYSRSLCQYGSVIRNTRGVCVWEGRKQVYHIK